MRLRASNAGGAGLISGQGTQIPHAEPCGQKNPQKNHRRHDVILHGREQKLCQKFKKQNHFIKKKIKHLVCVRHWVWCWDTGVSKVDKVPALMELPSYLEFSEMRSGKSIPGRENSMSKGPVVGRDLAYFRNKKISSEDD